MTKKILYVEDNPVNLALVRKVLTGAGYEVLEATDGMAGIKAAWEQSPDLILMDMNLPGMDGYEAATKIKGIEQLRDIPLIALTAAIGPGEREKSLAAGCDGYIAKPINAKTFVGEMEGYLGGKRESLKKREAPEYLREYSRRLVDSLEAKVEEMGRVNMELEAANADLKMSNVALEDAYERLLHMDRVKSDFVANVSHELRTPLTSIKSYAEILHDEIGNMEESQQKRFLRIIDSEADRLTRLVNNLLDIKKMEAGEMSWHDADFDVAGLCRETIRDFNPHAAGRGIDIRFDPEKNIPPVTADRDKIKQVLNNLISNAVKFSPEGAGRIDVSVGSGNGAGGGQGAVVVSVSDNGTGIESSEHGSIFETFYRAKTVRPDINRGGVGLGLSICRDIVEHYGGRIWVESSPGKGARFSFTLPVKSNG